MAVDMVFIIVYCIVFDSLHDKYNVNTQNKPVQLWHPMLSKNKTWFNFYIVQDDFVRQFRHMLVGEEPKRITQEAEEFLNGKGIFIQDENHTYI